MAEQGKSNNRKGHNYESSTHRDCRAGRLLAFCGDIDHDHDDGRQQNDHDYDHNGRQTGGTPRSFRSRSPFLPRPRRRLLLLPLLLLLPPRPLSSIILLLWMKRNPEKNTLMSNTKEWWCRITEVTTSSTAPGSGAVKAIRRSRRRSSCPSPLRPRPVPSLLPQPPSPQPSL